VALRELAGLVWPGNDAEAHHELGLGYWTGLVAATARASRPAMYISRRLEHLVNRVLGVMVTMIAAYFIVPSAFDGANWTAAAVGFAVILPSVMSFSLLLGNFAIVLRDWIVVRALAQILLMSFSAHYCR
jgi:hypothetical protein